MKENLAFYKKSGETYWTPEEFKNILDFVGDDLEDLSEDLYIGKWIYYIDSDGYYNWGDDEYAIYEDEYIEMAYEDIINKKEID